MRQARDAAPEIEGRQLLLRAAGHHQEAQAGVRQGVHPAHADPGGIAGLQREAAGLVLRSARLDQDEVAAEGGRRGDRPHPGDLRQPQAQAFVGADEIARLDHSLPEERPGQGVLVT